MRLSRIRTPFYSSALAIILAAGSGWFLSAARGDEAAPELTLPGPSLRQRHALPPSRSSSLAAEQATSRSGGWWLATAGIALALAAFGGASLAARRAMPGRTAGPLAIVGRLHLSPKHAVYVVRAGEQMLVVGTGAQGPPALLGEWTEAAAASDMESTSAAPAASRLDRRIGGAR